jgi:3-deoxy-D-manno-octulosonate 8-phosphate phosphatase (KDO 8-P phosphatase)
MLTSLITDRFRSIGGEFCVSPQELRERLDNARIFLFDWDGVFNAGEKGKGATSLYAEVDSMGLNMLRFGYYLQTGKIPKVGIITGQENHSAFHLAKREHFDVVYYKFHHKALALEHLEKEYGIQDHEVAMTFDDIADITLAKRVGLRFLVRCTAAILFNDYVRKNNYCEYITGHEGKDNAVREICELILGIRGVFEEAIEERFGYSEKFREYMRLRSSIETRFFVGYEDRVVPIEVHIENHRY